MTEVERYRAMLEVALEEARTGRSEGGVPIGAALFDGDGKLLASGRNRRVQQDDPSVHGETDAFRRAGRQRSYKDKVMVTTLAPCWYCSGLIRQFGIRTLVVGGEQKLCWWRGVVEGAWGQGDRSRFAGVFGPADWVYCGASGDLERGYR